MRFSVFQSLFGLLRRPAAGLRKRTWLGYLGESLTALVILSLTIFSVAVVALLWGWSQRDHYLTEMIRHTLERDFPEWNIEFATAELDQRGRVVLSEVIINPQGATVPLCKVQGIRVQIDRDLLLQQQRIDVQSIEINRPELTLIRQASGDWNWQNLPPLQEGAAAALPLAKIRDATVAVQWEHSEFDRALRVLVQAIDVDLLPAGQHRYQFEGIGREETLGTSQFSGHFDALHQTWELSGHLNGLQIDQPLLQMAAQISPQAQQVVAELQKSRMQEWQQPDEDDLKSQGSDLPWAQLAELMQPALQTGTETRIETVSQVQPVRAVQPFSLKLRANLQFHGSKQSQQEPDFTLFADLVNGQLDHPDLPMPLDRIEGQIAIDRLGIRIEKMMLASGVTSAEMTGAWGWHAQSHPASVPEELLVTLKNYRVGPGTRDFLPTGLRKLYDELNPAGQLSIAFRLRRGSDRPIEFDLFSAEVSDGFVQHVLFAYPVQYVQGTIVRTDHGIGPQSWALEMTGSASGRAVTVTGTVLDPGPQAETMFEINAAGVALDDLFYRALKPEQREVLEYLDLHGTADVNCVVIRKHEHGTKPIIRLDADVYEASVQVKGFPLSVRQLSAHINSDETGWQVTRLTGMHGETRINGFGTAVPVGEEWKLEMTLSAQQARFDHDLYLAVKKSSAEMAQNWERLRPRGEFDLTVNLDWKSGPDGGVQVAIPLMKLKNCELNPTPFPWRISDIQATLAIGRDGVVVFENLKAKHDECRIETSGSFAPRKDFWQLRFDQLVLDDLFPNHEFLAAVPRQFKEMVQSVKLQKPVSLAGMLEFKGDYAGEVVTAAWDAKAVFHGLDLSVGLDLTNLSGTMHTRGMMDRYGVVSVPEGRLALDSCWVMGYHVTDIKGPFRIDRDQIVLGSSKMFEPESPEEEWSTVSRHERLTGRIFGGELFLDLLAKRTEAMPYWMRCTLSRADIEQWAIQSNYGQANIRGEMNGYIDLAGDAVSTRNTIGNGRLLISPAALYELPIMFQMFQSLRLAPVDQTAFRDAYAQFRIQDEKFIFDEIGLLGESMSLFGQGTIRFDRTIDLDFVYRPPRRTRVNLASQVLNRLEGVLPVLFTVEVEGTLDVPKVTVQDGVRETLRGFVKMLEAGPANLKPPKILPPPRIRVQMPAQAAQPMLPAF